MAGLNILSIGFPVAGDLFDTGDFGDAPSLSNYDAVIVDLNEVSKFINSVALSNGSYHDYSGRKIVNPGGNQPKVGEVPVSELVGRRGREARLLMENGGMLICSAIPLVTHKLPRDWSIYEWIPLHNPNWFNNSELHPGDGPVGEILLKHPFTQFFSAYKNQLEYKVSFSKSFIEQVPIANVLASSRGGEAVALELVPFADLPGKLIFLPAIADSAHDEIKFTGVIQDCIVAAIGGDLSDTSPEWVEAWMLPGLEDKESVVSSSKLALVEAKKKVADAEEQRDKIAGFRKLLWTTGKFQLEPMVREAFSLMGFDAPSEGDRDAVLYDAGQKVAIAEIEGANGRIDVDKYRQLLDYVEDELTESGKELKGILVGNGYRLEQPDQRGDQFTEACRRGAERQRFCLLATTELFEVVKALLDDPSEEHQAKIRSDILGTTGDYRFSLAP